MLFMILIVPNKLKTFTDPPEANGKESVTDSLTHRQPNQEKQEMSPHLKIQAKALTPTHTLAQASL